MKNFFSDQKHSDSKNQNKLSFGPKNDETSSLCSIGSCSEKIRFKRNVYKRKVLACVQINMIPLIDVLLVLLIVFMITAETINSNVEINLPKAKSKTEKTLDKINQDEIVVFIDSKGFISFNEKQFMNFEEFENFLLSNSFLKSHQSKLSSEQEIILSSDKDVNYQKIIEILVALNNIGLYKIKMAYKNF